MCSQNLSAVRQRGPLSLRAVCLRAVCSKIMCMTDVRALQWQSANNLACVASAGAAGHAAEGASAAAAARPFRHGKKVGVAAAGPLHEQGDRQAKLAATAEHKQAAVEAAGLPAVAGGSAAAWQPAPAVSSTPAAELWRKFDSGSTFGNS